MSAASGTDVAAADWADTDADREAADALAELDSSRSFAQRLVDGVARRMGRRTDRRSFLAATATVGSAMVVSPLRYVLRPVAAQDLICGPANECSQGWTVFCCSIHDGRNTCPPGTVAAGWWKADQSPFCGGAARYYLDCNASCHPGCGCGPSGICGSHCHDWTCSCGQTGCDRRRIACNAFRYGQCHQEIPCVGPVVCRVVSCVPPWQWYPACTAEVATANATRFHTAPCLEGGVSAFGAAVAYGQPTGSVAGIEATPSGLGYWLVTVAGDVAAFGDATPFDGIGIPIGGAVVDLATTPDGSGLWLFAADGGVFTQGTAQFHGSAGGIDLVAPIVGGTASPTGDGYWMVGADGGVFAFGDAAFLGSIGDLTLNQPIVGMAAAPDRSGYWLVARDGGLFTFGAVEFLGSLVNAALAAPIVGIAATPTGAGYWMVAADGGVFTFGDAAFHGSLPASDPSGVNGPAVDLDATPLSDGYWIATGRT